MPSTTFIYGYYIKIMPICLNLESLVKYLARLQTLSQSAKQGSQMLRIAVIGTRVRFPRGVKKQLF